MKSITIGSEMFVVDNRFVEYHMKGIFLYKSRANELHLIKNRLLKCCVNFTIDTY